MATDSATALVVVSGIIGILFALFQYKLIANIKIQSNANESASDSLTASTSDQDTAQQTQRLNEIYEAIRVGAQSFLFAEYSICGVFMVGFGLIVFILVSWGQDWDMAQGAFTTISFLLGAATSILSGYIGMTVAVFSNARTTVSAQKQGWTECFNTAFRAGGVMGFALCSLAMLVLFVLLEAFKGYFSTASSETGSGEKTWATMMECVSGYGLGGSSIAMFGRVGGGIYTKAADVGADLVGKVVHGIPEDDPRNPATIADNVGDNVGDVAGMGADLFGSFAESTCAALVISTSISGDKTLIAEGWGAILFPLTVAGAGILVCLVCSFIATHIAPTKKEEDVERNLKIQLMSTTVLITPVFYILASAYLPSGDFFVPSIEKGTLSTNATDVFVCLLCGVWGGLIIGLITEYYTSHSYQPVREVADSCKTGSATNIIYGLALGYKSVIIPIFVLAFATYLSFKLCDMYGVALCAVGMLSTLATGLTIDSYGPVCDNAGGIAEMAELHPLVREKTDALDAAGNTTAAIGKGYCIGSAGLVSLALFGAFVTRLNNLVGNADADLDTVSVNVLNPITFSGLLVGAMLPYWFSAMTMKSVGLAAMQMVEEVERQFSANPRLLDPHTSERPDYDACIQISTRASLREMIAPGALVMLAPLITGTLFGVNAVCGLLAGGLVSGIQMAISASNTGGAWDNAKKYIEKAKPDSDLQGKGSDVHKAAVVGDTVGDPLKDTSGPALNILMKLMAIISLVFTEYFAAIDNGKGLFGTSQAVTA